MMNDDRVGLRVDKLAFEPSELVEYGAAEEMTQIQVSADDGGDGNIYQS